MRQMANHEMKNLSSVDSDPPSRTPEAKSIILAASWQRVRTVQISAANVGLTACQGTIMQIKK
jgi:hypothetical protein